MSRLFVFASLGGLIAGSTAGLFVSPTLSTIAPIWCLVVCAWWSRSSRWLAIGLLFLSIGWLRSSAATWPGQHDLVRHIDQRVTITGAIMLPGQTRDGTQTIVLTKTSVDGVILTGSVQVRLPAIPHIAAGGKGQVTCTLQELNGAWRRQWSQGIHVRCSAAEMRIVTWPDPDWRTQLGRAQEGVITYVRNHFREPQASLLNGILIGNTDGMPSAQQQAFQATGTTHIVALSGFNVTIILTVMLSWLNAIIGRRWAWMPAVFLVTGFIIMSGASASVVRAGCMTAIAQVALYIGRPVTLWRLVAYAAIIMMVINPLIALFDLGFQLSFLATIGLVGLSEPLTVLLQRWLRGGGWVGNLSTTLAAMLMTEPLLLWRFGRLSLIAPFINMAVLPLIPITMAVGSLSLIGLLWEPLGVLTIPVADALLRAVLWIITWGAHVPHAWANVSPAVATMIAIGCAMVSVQLFRRHETPHHNC